MAFVDETRQNIRRAAATDYVSGGASTVPLARVGYLGRIHIHFSGTMTVTPGTGTVAISEQGPYALIRRLRYQIGSGTELYNVSGFGSSIIERSARLGYEPDDGHLPTQGFEVQIFNCPVISGANSWEFGLTIPITPNERDELGLILLQSEGTVTQLIIEWQQAGGPTHDYPVVLTGNATATFVGTASVYLETFTVPIDVTNQPSLDRIHQVLEKVDPIFAVGQNSIKLLEENTYLRIIHIVKVNGRLSTDAVERRALRYNVTDSPYELERKMDLQLQRRRWTQDYPKGVFTWELFDQGYPNFGGDRDLIAASGLAELESIFYIDPATSLGSNNNTISTIQQQVVKVATPTM